jgi:hypothetical protein
MNSQQRAPVKPLVAYFRVSTREQGRSGLGIDAQRAAVIRFAAAEGHEVVGEFVEIETGKGADAIERRPQLAAALAEARRHGKCAVAAGADAFADSVAPAIREAQAAGAKTLRQDRRGAERSRHWDGAGRQMGAAGGREPASADRVSAAADGAPGRRRVPPCLPTDRRSGCAVRGFPIERRRRGHLDGEGKVKGARVWKLKG